MGIDPWGRLPAGMNAVALARNALKENIIFAPGNVFSTRGGWDDYRRFNVAMCDDGCIFSFLVDALG